MGQRRRPTSPRSNFRTQHKTRARLNRKAGPCVVYLFLFLRPPLAFLAADRFGAAPRFPDADFFAEDRVAPRLGARLFAAVFFFAPDFFVVFVVRALTAFFAFRTVTFAWRFTLVTVRRTFLTVRRTARRSADMSGIASLAALTVEVAAPVAADAAEFAAPATV